MLISYFHKNSKPIFIFCISQIINISQKKLKNQEQNITYIIIQQLPHKKMDSTIMQKKKLHETLLSFPPFFTLQQHEQSRRKQINYWAEIIHSYCRNQNIINSSISQISNLPIVQDNSTGIQKKLTKEEITIIMKQLQKLGCVEFQFGTQKLLISHFSPYEMADDMYKWAKDNFLIGDVETLQFIAQGDHTTPKQKFYKQPKQILLKVIDILQKSNKAAKIQIGNDISVKFL